MIKNIDVPMLNSSINLQLGDRVEISGVIYTARDAIMPKLVDMINNGSIHDLPVKLSGAVIMHTAFSLSGFGPTSSNKEAIESAMGTLSKAGVKIHIGKGALKQETVEEVSKYGAVYVVAPPVSALLQSRLVSKKVVAFKDEGMEALHEISVKNLPGIVAAANGQSIFYN